VFNRKRKYKLLLFESIRATSQANHNSNSAHLTIEPINSNQINSSQINSNQISSNPNRTQTKLSARAFLQRYPYHPTYPKAKKTPPITPPRKSSLFIKKKKSSLSDKVESQRSGRYLVKLWCNYFLIY
jgi:hypothetical protein